MNSAFFPQINTSEMKYDVHIDAFSKGGITSNPMIEFSFKTNTIHNMGK